MSAFKAGAWRGRRIFHLLQKKSEDICLKQNVFMTSGRSVADAASRCRAAASADVVAAVRYPRGLPTSGKF